MNSHVYVLRLSISTIFRLDFVTVPTVCYFFVNFISYYYYYQSLLGEENLGNISDLTGGYPVHKFISGYMYTCGEYWC